MELGKCSITPFPDGETFVKIEENVRGEDIFIIQPTSPPTNHNLMELFIMIDALRRASATRITAVLPFYGYARQDRKDQPRVPITAKLVADMLEKAGVTRVLTMDLHTDQIQGFFNIPVDNLFARPLLVEAIKGEKIKKGIVVSPDIGSNRMARKYAEDLNLDIAIVDKRRVSASQVEVNAIIGDVKDRQVILVDDICSTGSTLETAAKICRKEGAKGVMAAISHGLFVGETLPQGIDRFFVANTVPYAEKNPKVKVVSAAHLFGEAIDCVIQAKSISSLFKRH